MTPQTEPISEEAIAAAAGEAPTKKSRRGQAGLQAMQARQREKRAAELSQHLGHRCARWQTAEARGRQFQIMQVSAARGQVLLGGSGLPRTWVPFSQVRVANDGHDHPEASTRAPQAAPEPTRAPHRGGRRGATAAPRVEMIDRPDLRIASAVTEVPAVQAMSESWDVPENVRLPVTRTIDTQSLRYLEGARPIEPAPHPAPHQWAVVCQVNEEEPSVAYPEALPAALSLCKFWVDTRMQTALVSGQNCELRLELWHPGGRVARLAQVLHHTQNNQGGAHAAEPAVAVQPTAVGAAPLAPGARRSRKQSGRSAPLPEPAGHPGPGEAAAGGRALVGAGRAGKRAKNQRAARTGGT